MPTNDPFLAPDQIFDGYHLIRFLGRGGFGEVWLCRSGATGTYHALKFISGRDSDLIEKEHHSLGLYRSAAARLRSPHLVPIEHINRHTAGLYYVMPLADGITDVDPADPDWQPQSLASRIEAQVHATAWFSSQDIIGLIHPLLDALQSLSDAGLVHRDVKPDNILFFNGSPCLGDISLLGEDATVITRRGTPGYATPSWYQGGLPDMYGAAATLYTLLTGNPPDKMGRTAFLWPPQGEHSLPESERSKWKLLHAVIRRATEEKVGERYVDFRAMAAAVASAGATITLTDNFPSCQKEVKWNRAAWVMAAIVLLLLIVIAAKTLLSPTPVAADNAKEILSPSLPGAEPADEAEELSSIPMPDSSATLRAYEDAEAATYSLFNAHLPYESAQTDHDLFFATVAAIQSLATDREAFEPEMAVRKLDECLDTISELRDIPNVLLARLLLRQAAGAPPLQQSEISDPIFTKPGTDNLSDRVNLLCRLNAIEQAEVFLNRVLEGSSLSTRKRSDALIERAKIRIKLGKVAEAHLDAGSALATASDDPALKVGVEMKLRHLESSHPAYAAYLKTQPEK